MMVPTLTQNQLIILGVVLLLFAIPTGMLLKRSGRNPLWALLCFVPALALVGLWVLALCGAKRTDA